ncbi:MAG: type II secretion system GspH family protein [Pirellulaceae bacterium]|nr:type II secretion system GspH family protein [Pirellulaceae bacterium]
MMQSSVGQPRRPLATWCRPSFTLVELLVVMSIIAILSSAVLMALSGVMEDAKGHRTRSQITRIHELLAPIYESYQTRPVPLVPRPSSSYHGPTWEKLAGLREIMRMELPDRRNDVYRGPFSGLTSAPARWNAYRRRVMKISNTGADGVPGSSGDDDGNGQAEDLREMGWPGSDDGPTFWTAQHQGAECLYLILAEIREGGSNGLDFFQENEIGDVDGDGMAEILDGWGNPIEFLRWAPGFSQQPGADGQWGVAAFDDDSNGVVDDASEAGWPLSDDLTGLSDLQDRNPERSPDPFDLLRTDAIDAGADGGWGISGTDDDGFNGVDDAMERGWPGSDDRVHTFALTPLIFSAGPDQIYDLVTDAVRNGSNWTCLSPDTDNPAMTVNDVIDPVNPPVHPMNQPLNKGNDPFLWFPADYFGTAQNWQLGKYLTVTDSDPTYPYKPEGPYGDNISNHRVEVR